MSLAGFQSHPALITDYDAAVAKIEAMRSAEMAAPGFHPDLRSILLNHGQKTRRAVLWLHGYCSGTAQFKPLSDLCYTRGYNAFIPCLPHHGFQDRLSPEISKVKARELVRFTDEMVDLMHGLGDEIIVGGLSMGGALAAWVAQQRPDVATVLIIAPFLGARIIPTRLTKAVAYGFQYLPDIRQWWDPETKEATPGPPYGYLQHSTHSLSQILQVGSQVLASARRQPPAAGKVWMVINDHDGSVNNELNRQLVDTWLQSGARNVETFHFPDSLGIPHDCISIDAPRGNTGVVYPELMRMIG